MAKVEFFFDPACPWAWLTSRWIRNVQAERPMKVEWRFIALRIINEAKDYATDFPEGYVRSHGRGLELLRVCAAVRQTDPEQVIDAYTAFGTIIHRERNATALDDEAGVATALTRFGLDGKFAAARLDSDFDGVIRGETAEALSRCGGNVGTPIISWDLPEGPSFFGPVISKAPVGPEAVLLWDAITELGSNPWFSELKRSTRSRPQFD